MGKKLSTYWKGHIKDHPQGYCEIHINYKEEMYYIKYFDNNNILFFTEDFPNKSLHYVECAAENWALGIKKLEDSM